MMHPVPVLCTKIQYAHDHDKYDRILVYIYLVYRNYPCVEGVTVNGYKYGILSEGIYIFGSLRIVLGGNRDRVNVEPSLCFKRAPVRDF